MSGVHVNVDRAGRFHLGLVLAAVAALVLVLLQALSAPATSADGDCQDRGVRGYTPETRAIFNDPNGTVAEQFRIVATVVRNIDGTPPGGHVRIATLAIRARSVVDALVEAHRCRVHVRVVVPGRAWEDPAVVELRGALGSDESSGSWITRCDGSCTSAGTRGIMHLKSYLFSEVAGVPDVTVHGSSNLTRSQATHRWNDAYQVVRNADVYASATAFFDQLRRDKDLEFPRLVKTPGHWQYYFPSGREFHLEVLDRTRCQSSSGRTTIDFAASIWKQVEVAEKLADLHDAGCGVRVQLNLEKIEGPVLQTLLDRGVPTRVRQGTDPEGATHSKYIAIQGMHDGYVVSTVYSGSSNVSGFSTHTADNSMIRVVDDAAVHAAYVRNFDRVWGGSGPLRAADAAEARSVNARTAEAAD